MKASDLLTRDEIRFFTETSDWAGARAVLGSWAIIIGCFAVLARFPHALTFVVVVVVLGGRQLALAILMHEGSHATLFRRRFLNDVVTDWLCARPVWSDVGRYRVHHMKHHTHTGTENDPDLGLVTPFPTTRASIVRKLARDVTGLSALKRIFGLLLMDAGLLVYNVSGSVERLPHRGAWFHGKTLARNLAPMLLTNAAMFLALRAFGHGWVYLAWVAAYCTSYSVFLRIRSMAEHACTERSRDPTKNTRTTKAGLLARLTVAPLSVNYHVEHHLLMTVPYFRLAALHRTLVERGALPAGSIARSYREVLQKMSAATG
jgi:fatty acid desaturase